MGHRFGEDREGSARTGLRRSLALVAGGAAASLPLATSAVAAPAVCACGGGGGSAGPPPAPPDEETARETAPAQPEVPIPPPPTQPAPAPSVPTTPDAAERWLEEDEEPEATPPPRPTRRAPTPEDSLPVEESAPAPEPAPEPAVQETPPARPPSRQVYGVDAELYRRLGAEDQQAIRDDYEQDEPPTEPPPPSLPVTPDAAERRMADEPEPTPRPTVRPPVQETPAVEQRLLEEEPPAPSVRAAPESAAPESPGPRVYGVDADLYRRLGIEDQTAIRDSYLGVPPQPPVNYSPCSPLEPFHERVCIEHPAEVHDGDEPMLCVPGEGPRVSSCRGVTVDEAEDPAAAGAIWCHPVEGPYIGTRPCAPGEAPPPQGPAFEQAPEPSTDYESWHDPARRGRERYARFDEALPTAREWETGDFQARDDGTLRFGLFIASEDSGIGPVRGEGDNRTFDPQFSPYATRAYIEVDFENDRAYVVANPTCEPGGGCNDAKHIGSGSLGDYSNEVTLEEQHDGDIYIQYELANARLPGPLSGASIDGHITVRPKDDGTFEVIWFGDRYPSWEAYYDDACGTTWILTQDEEGEITDLLPVGQ